MQAAPPSLRTGPFSNRCVNCAGELARPEGRGEEGRRGKGKEKEKGIAGGGSKGGRGRRQEGQERKIHEKEQVRRIE